MHTSDTLTRRPPGWRVLSICVPTVPGRESLLSRCLHSITEQAQGRTDVEVLVIAGDGYLGDKVNLAVGLALGEWVTVVDDDDWLAACYVELVIAALESDPDYVGLRVLEMSNGRYINTVATSGGSKEWDPPPRLPVPKGVIRRSIAQSIRFENDYNADRRWATQAAAQVNTWIDIDRSLYIYDYWSDRSAYGGGEAVDVGWWPHDEAMIRRFTLDRR